MDIAKEGKFIDMTAGTIGGTGGTGADGLDGASAYEVATTNGFIGSEEEWLATLGIITLEELDTIKENVVTAINNATDYREITYVDELPRVIETWETSAKAVHTSTTTLLYTAGLPTTKTVVNHLANVIVVQTITYDAGGLPSVIEKT